MNTFIQMDLYATLNDIRVVLRDNIDEKILTSEKKFFKEDVKILGVNVSTVSKIAKLFFESIKDYSKQDILALCEELWKSGYSEEAYIACHFSYCLSPKYEPVDFIIFERWVYEYVTNWATCDTLCNHSIGTFIEMYPNFISELKKWAKSTNRWVKRAAAVTLIIPARKGLFLDDIFEIADILLVDTDDLVQKGYGWMLKATSEAHLEGVFNFVMTRKADMPRTALRYAIEKMPSEMKMEAMKKEKPRHKDL
ncbi:MAG: alkylation repair enzyme protein [Bacteroidetes bacterium]|nr:alkylation repair enzyme protein [Bacteroidota bacterium]